MTWTVQLYPEEKAFIDEVFRRTLNNEDGRGDMIAPIRGGIIYMNEYDEYTEDQTKWLLFCRLQDAAYKMSGVPGMKFMNFTYNNELPEILVDPEAEDKWGTKRMTTDGQPVNDYTGIPLHMMEHQKAISTLYQWNDESKSFKKTQEHILHESFTHDGFPVPEKVLD